MKAGIINVPTKVGPANWATCFNLMADQAPVFGLNEAKHPNAKGTYRALARGRNLGVYGLRQGPNPVFWDRERFRRTASAHHRLHVRGESALARRWPGFNDARYVTEVVLRDRQDKTTHAVLCSHWVPNGGKVPNAWRAWARAEAKRGVKRLAKAHLAQGRTVWFLGDTNIKEPFRFGGRRRFRWLKGEGIDKVGLWVPAGTTVTNARGKTFPAPTDHHRGVVGHATLTRRTR